MGATAAPQGSIRRIAVIGPSGRAILRLRGNLIRDLVLRQHHVLALAPDLNTQDAQALRAIGGEAAGFSMKPESFSLWPRRAAIKVLAAQIRDWTPHAVLVFGSAISPFAIASARRAGVANVVLMISELGEGGPGVALRRAIKGAHTVVTHNQDDYRALVNAMLDGSARRIVRVAGAGADLAAIGPLPVPGLDKGLVFLMAARLDKEKGAREFCEAARMIKNEGGKAQFLIAGPEGSGEGALRPEDMTRFAGSVEFLGDACDLRPVLQRAHVFVAPSHLEGMPHAVQQAMAAGRPVIVTDVAGSRETADEMVNGIVVAPRDSKALADAFRRVLKNKDLIAAMGRASRSKAERQFDVTQVNAQLRSALGLA